MIKALIFIIFFGIIDLIIKAIKSSSGEKTGNNPPRDFKPNDYIYCCPKCSYVANFLDEGKENECPRCRSVMTKTTMDTRTWFNIPYDNQRMSYLKEQGVTNPSIHVYVPLLDKSAASQTATSGGAAAASKVAEVKLEPKFVCKACGARKTGWYNVCPDCGAQGKMEKI